MKKFILYGVIITLLFTNCASIVHGSKQMVVFSSKPLGAKLFIDDKGYGLTPATIILNRNCRLNNEKARKKEYNIRIEFDGYYPYEVDLKRSIDGWFFGNILIGGLLGIAIDAFTGSMYRLTPDHVFTILAPENATIQTDDPGLFISVVLQIDPDWQKIGQLTRL